MNNARQMHLFVHGIKEWYLRHKRSLPWRDLKVKDRSHRAYLILVSEIMLQQTQVSRVIILYKNFIQTFPTIKELSKASDSQIIRAWRGLGYNSRALRLRDAARTIQTLQNGKFPDSMEALLSIKGIGPYTAAAVRNFAFGLPTPCIDTNIRRILHRFFIGLERKDGSLRVPEKQMFILATSVLDVAMKVGMKTEDYHAALMDFGALICTKNTPKWHLFSPKLKSSCISYGKQINRTKKLIKKEPGRHMAGRYVPDRIFRGRVVEALRDAEAPLKISDIGRHIAIDWSEKELKTWLKNLLDKLERDGLVIQKRKHYMLPD